MMSAHVWFTPLTRPTRLTHTLCDNVLRPRNPGRPPPQHPWCVVVIDGASNHHMTKHKLFTRAAAATAAAVQAAA